LRGARVLFPGHYHRDVPRDLAGNLAYRAEILRLCDDHPEYRAAVVEMCRDDLLFYINVFVWQYNPDHFDGECGPFITWPSQEDALLETAETLFVTREDVIWEKSRKEGGTWLAMILEDHICRFRNDKKFLDISHSEQAVWRPDDKDSLFWKLHFIQDHLPEFLGATRRRKMGIHYPGTGSGINGAATTKRSGVGGRGTVVLDEFAKQDDASSIWSHTRDVGPRLVISTHYGVGTKFYNLCTNPNIKRVVMHWTKNPTKARGLYRADPSRPGVPQVLDQSYEFPPDYPFVLDGSPHGGPFPGLRSPWYDAEARARSPRDMAMHIDINAQGSSAQVFDQAMIRRLQGRCFPPFHKGVLTYDPDLGLPKRFAAADAGDMKLWCHLDHQGNPPRRRYGAGADVSQGTGATNSCLSVIDGTTGEKVFEYAVNNMPPERFGVLCVAVCRFFADKGGDGAKLAWEAMGPGSTFKNVVMDDCGYRHVFFRPRSDLNLSHLDSENPGWAPTPSNKDMLIREYMTALSAGDCTNWSFEALEECLAFEYDKSSGHIEHSGAKDMEDPSGAKQNHGDRVIADALAWKMAARTVVTEPQKRAERETMPGPDSFLARRKLRESRTQNLSEAWV
jgi:hypothetical protein